MERSFRSNSAARSPAGVTPRERRRNRLRAPFGDEDIPIVFAGAGGRELFHRRLSANRGTAFIYDDRMLLHKNEWYPTYPECPERGIAVRDRCDSCGLLSRCILMTADPAQDDILLYIHRNTHIVKTAQTEYMSDNERRSLSGGLDSAYFNEHTNMAARLAVGSLIQAVESVHRGEVRNAFCLVRPPGHHAMEDEACGFCIFNNVALAAQYALDKLEYNRVLILDWDVHHGQATQYSFYDSSRVLYISIHRYDEQTFWPSLRESNFDFIGSGRGRGYNINIPLNGGDDLGDAEYLAIFHRLILPVAYEFDPDLILVSAGYDCAYGCPLGQLKVTPPLFAHFTHKLMGLAEGKIIVSLEGGYYHDSLAESAAHTVSALLGDPMPSLEPVGEVHASVLETIANCVSVLRFRWRSLSVFQVPEVVPAAERKHLPEQTWKARTATVPSLDVKVPTMKPEKHIHDPEDAIRIDQYMSYLKRTHPVALHKHFPSTCIVYDSRMENHKNEEDPNHPEAPNRIRRTYELLDEYGLARRCKRVEARYATRTELCRVHATAYVDMIAKTATLDQTALDSLSNEENSIFFNRHTYDCARLAAGSVLAVVDEVCTGQSLNGVALVRPPGHHALTDKCMGFCFFNNVAMGAKHAQQVHGLERIAIVDWDVHHGNGTEKIFENDPSVLFISVHRYDEGRYYPSTADADPTVCGSEDGLGRTVQVAWNGRHVKDGEYIAVFVHIILPILYEFRPQLILVSAGFDAARGDRLGGLGVSPECFAHLTHLLLTAAYLCPAKSVTDDKTDSQVSTPVRQTRHRLAQQQRTFTGGLILALEGGYHLTATAEAMCHSVASLLGDCCPRLAFGLSPTEKGCRAIRRSLCTQETYWKSVQGYGPVRGQLITDESGRLSGSSEHHIGSQSALAFTGQLETDIQSRLEDLSLSDGASRSVGSPLSHPAALISPSFSLAVTSPIGIGSVSTSVPTNGVAARVPAATEQETLQDLGTDLFTSHMSAGHVASTSVIPSSSSATSQGAVNLPQLIDEFTQMRVASPNTGQSDRSSLASDVPSPVQHRRTLTNAAGASGHAQSSSTPIASAENQVVAIATLQDLMHVASIETEDMHAFFGLESSQQLPERLFAVTPLSWCPHLTSVHNNPEWNPNIRETCNRCTNQTENWVCLTCYSVFCGRYANSHMVEHFTSTRHPLVLSFADLSSWCYECEAYVHNEALSEAKQTAHRAKFGVDATQAR
ncbi:Histone deacetylase 6 [Clonorchis sinensis]|uniref:Histone deacetylase 6 n=1 Tax=Clonorchis sinensis TaxID=79923 RepID=A0A8T1M6Q3_CLOSI|nr:Histone deacetylase 6 [Clonorchis sinensis]